MDYKLVFYSCLVAFFSGLIVLIYLIFFIDSWRASISSLFGVLCAFYFYYLNKPPKKPKKEIKGR